MEKWKTIDEFPAYRVSELGYVYHAVTGRSLSRLYNNTGLMYVSMWRDGKAHSRSVARLVANAFLPTPEFDTFDTPVHLDGDRSNNRASNLVWRPNWFARKYRAQFRNNLRGFRVPVEIVETGEQFPNSWEAALKYGLIDREILIASMDRQPVWPANYTFRPVNTPYQLA